MNMVAEQPREVPAVCKRNIYKSPLFAAVAVVVAFSISIGLAESPPSPTTQSANGVTQGEGGTQPATQSVQAAEEGGWMYADLILRDSPNALDPLIDATWPQPGIDFHREKVLEQSLGRRSNWTLDSINVKDNQKWAQAHFVLGPYQSRMVVAVLEDFVGTAIPNWEAIRIFPGPRAAMGHLQEDEYQPLQLFEYAVSQRANLAPNKPRETRSRAERLFTPFEVCARVSVRVSSPHHVAFVDYLSAERVPSDGVTRDSATIVVFDRATGAIQSMMTVQFWPDKRERESIESIVNVLLAGLSPAS
jgi:hypothetical protein